MAKRGSTSRNRARNVKTPVVYFSGSLIGLEISDSTDDVILKTDSLESTPTFLFYDSDSKVILDYGHASEKDMEILRVFFENMSAGDSFTIDDDTALFTKSRDTKITANLSGTYTLISYKGKSIVANVTSVTNKDTKVSRYEAKYFTTTPRLTKSGTDTSERTLYTIRNNSGPDSSYSFREARPILKGDFIELDTSLNSGRYEIIDYKLENGVEVLTIADKQGSTLVEEDLVGTMTAVSLLRMGYREKELPRRLRTSVKEIREQAETDQETKGTCCLYLTENQRIEDTETGRVFTESNIYACGCQSDWECVFLADHMNMNYVFNSSNRNFCESGTDAKCMGYMAFPDSPDDDSNVRCACCTETFGESVLPEEKETSATPLVQTTRGTASVSSQQNPVVTGPVVAGVVNVSTSLPFVSFAEKKLAETIRIRFENDKLITSGRPPVRKGRSYRFSVSDPSNFGTVIQFRTDNGRSAPVYRYGLPGKGGAYYLVKIPIGTTSKVLSIYDVSKKRIVMDFPIADYIPEAIAPPEPKYSVPRQPVVSTTVEPDTIDTLELPPTEIVVTVDRSTSTFEEFTVVVRSD